MFFEKLIVGGIGGAALGVLMAITALFKGEPFSKAGELFFGSIIIGIIAAFWFGGDSNGHAQDSDHEVSDLYAQLQNAHHAIGMYEQDGDYNRVSHWRSEVARIESELRRRGA